ncbi:uncharacterized protein LY89DRAFT_214608 [Mollisia scopiformis]|uniref:Uncharacterized protein n=1 Tax=Mollisia scopiformis TaxID=149040 RepID=A0A194WW30_MOLSC|nr:uncharacterized protein LY89DRAFT_214608 [Mollisia scopiformis]KUJ11879.1 hypothetical protein LY89DRAFT_214608 [Mollisia scopiformis]
MKFRHVGSGRASHAGISHCRQTPSTGRALFSIPPVQLQSTPSNSQQMLAEYRQSAYLALTVALKAPERCRSPAMPSSRPESSDSEATLVRPSSMPDSTATRYWSPQILLIPPVEFAGKQAKRQFEAPSAIGHFLSSRIEDVMDLIRHLSGACNEWLHFPYACSCKTKLRLRLARHLTWGSSKLFAGIQTP